MTERDRFATAEMIEKGTAFARDVVAEPNPLLTGANQAAAKRAVDERGPHPWPSDESDSLPFLPDPEEPGESPNEPTGRPALSGEEIQDARVLARKFAWCGPMGKLHTLLTIPDRLFDRVIRTLNAQGHVAPIDLDALEQELEAAGFAGDQALFRSLVMDTLYGHYAEVGWPRRVAEDPIRWIGEEQLSQLKEAGLALNDAGITLLDSLSAIPVLGTWLGLGSKGTAELLDYIGQLVRMNR